MLTIFSNFNRNECNFKLLKTNQYISNCFYFCGLKNHLKFFKNENIYIDLVHQKYIEKIWNQFSKAIQSLILCMSAREHNLGKACSLLARYLSLETGTYKSDLRCLQTQLFIRDGQQRLLFPQGLLLNINIL